MTLFSRLASIVLLVILGGLSLVDASSVNLDSNWIPFLGRFHPVLLHLPIGIFAGVVLLEVYVLVRNLSGMPEKIHFLLNTTFYLTAVTSLLGIFLSWEGGYETDALDLHKWGGLATAAAILILDWSLENRNSEKVPTAYLAGLIVTVGLISVTGHLGGSLTHGSGFLTQFNPFSSENELEPISEDTPVYISHIQPIFQDYCVQCHSPEKIKGELRLDTFEMIMAGGLNGPAIVLGDSEGSNLVHVIHLPLDSNEHMPPKGQPQPSEEIVQLLTWWIDQGASETAKQEDLEITPAVASHFLKVDVLEFLSREEIAIQLEALEDRSTLTIDFLAQNDQRLGVHGKKASDQDLQALLPLKPNITKLNLGDSAITDTGLETIGRMTNLTHLHLNNTSITDEGIKHLGNLYQLTYLNLYGTDIGDAALLVLRRIKSLKKIFFWGTRVTREAAADLHQSVFPAVESDRLRIQIDELSKKRANLEVDIVSDFDLDLEAIKKDNVVSEPEN